MNPWELDATGLMIWGLVVHLIADWPLQNDWMAQNKANRASLGHWMPDERWYIRHPSAYVHAGIHGILLAVVFGWPALFLAIIHLIIDTRTPLVWWSKLVKQTQPEIPPPLVDIGTEVRFWTDQVFHIIFVAVAALVIG